MAAQFSQLVSTTFDGVANEKNAADQWSESAVLRHLEKMGGVKRVPGGATLELTLDYRANPGADFLATDSSTTSTAKTEVIDAASYSWAKLAVPVNWSLADAVLNQDPNRKIDLVSSIVNNAIASHDDEIETGLFAATATNSFESLLTINTEAGTGTIGGINSSTETYWASQFLDYDAGATLIEDMSELANDCAKGSGGSEVNLIITDATRHSIYEGDLIANQRYEGGGVGVSGFKALKHRNADVIFSHRYTSDSYFFINTKFLKLYVVKGGWRKRTETVEHVNALMANMKVFSVCAIATSNRSRGGVLFT